MQSYVQAASLEVALRHSLSLIRRGSPIRIAAVTEPEPYQGRWIRVVRDSTFCSGRDQSRLVDGVLIGIPQTH